MSTDSLIDGHVLTQQCKRAVDALLAHATKFEEQKAESQLLPGKEQNVWLVVNTKVMHPEKKLKPARIPVKYPIVDPRTSPVCLITKDPQREYKDRIASQGIKFISRVVDIRHLKGKWHPFEARRMLLKENGLFLADERVVPLLPRVLGKIFFEAKKQPIPVCITRKDLKGELERAISATYFHQNQGTCTSVKIGTITQKPAQILANLETALPEVVKHIKGEWDNIQSLFIKTNSSAALPIWQCDLGAGSGGRWDGLVMDASESEDEDVHKGDKKDSESGEDGKGEILPDVKSKGKKRAAEDVGAEKETPKKKAKVKATEAKASSVEPPAARKEVQPTSTPAATSSEPAKKKRRPSEGEPAPTPGAPSGPDTLDEKLNVAPKRKRKDVLSTKDTAAPAPVASTETIAAPPAKKEKRKKARASLAADAAPSTSIPSIEADKPSSAVPDKSSAAPATPPVPTNKRRASAVDFFDDAAQIAATPAPAIPANPPNTPAEGLVGETPAKRKRRAKSTVADTPVSTAIAKLTEPAEEGEKTAETPSVKRPRRRKQKGAAGGDEKSTDGEPETSAPQSTVVAEDASAPAEKKRKRKHKDEGLAVAKPDAPTLSTEEIKQKRSVAGVERKKERVLGGKPAAKSAKDELVGKKSKKL